MHLDTRATLVLVLASAACHRGVAPGVGAAGVVPTDFVALDGAPRFDAITVSQAPGGYRTDVRARARQPAAGQAQAIDLVIINLHGPGTYRFGFAWDRGATRATVTTADGTACMTPGNGRDAGALEVIASPADGKLAAGARLEGRYELRCFPRGDPERGAETTFTGRFVVTAR